MYKKYTTPCPIHGMWGSRKTSCHDLANKTNIKKSFVFFLFNYLTRFLFKFDFYPDQQILTFADGMNNEI